jgi:hypothetical protein
MGENPKQQLSPEPTTPPGLADVLQLLLVVATDWARREFDQQIAR